MSKIDLHSCDLLLLTMILLKYGFVVLEVIDKINRVNTDTLA